MVYEHWTGKRQPQSLTLSREKRRYRDMLSMLDPYLNSYFSILRSDTECLRVGFFGAESMIAETTPHCQVKVSSNMV